MENFKNNFFSPNLDCIATNTLQLLSGVSVDPASVKNMEEENKEK